jgi:hypothetical protein
LRIILEEYCLYFKILGCEKNEKGREEIWCKEFEIVTVKYTEN